MPFDDKDWDDEHWQEATRHVKPLPGKKRVIDTTVDDLDATSVHTTKEGPQGLTPDPAAQQRFGEGSVKGEPITSKQGWKGQVDTLTQKRLEKGEVAFTRRLDLHGYTQAEAFEVTMEFIKSSWSLGHRCVLIIHGKGEGMDGGMGVLRRALPDWLKATPEVLAFAYALPRHGGDGASYVMLRRNLSPVDKG